MKAERKKNYSSNVPLDFCTTADFEIKHVFNEGSAGVLNNTKLIFSVYQPTWLSQFNTNVKVGWPLKSDLAHQVFIFELKAFIFAVFTHQRNFASYTYRLESVRKPASMTHP